MAPAPISPPPSVAHLSPHLVKPILKRKRSSDSPPPPPVKRSRVAFEPEVDIKIEEKYDHKDVALVHEEISYAIRHRNDSGKEEYDQIKSYFALQPTAEDAISNVEMCKYLAGLISNSSTLTRAHSDLVLTILNHHWLARDETFVTLYTRFLGHLVSSHGGYLSQVLKMLVENFSHLSTSVGHNPPMDVPDRATLRDRVHRALKYVLRVVPSGSNTLSAIIRGAFPYADESRKVHVQYVKNLLRLIEYCPELRSDIFDLITDRLMKLDVEVQMDVEDLEEDVGEILAQSASIMSNSHSQSYQSDEDLDSDDDMDEEESLVGDEKRFKSLSVTVEKMDALLDILFETHASSTSNTDHLKPRSSSTFDLLLSQFSKTIIRTYRSRHTQFLLFHFVQASPDYVDRFVTTCLDILKSRSDNVLRVSAAAYLASFVARGARLSASTVQQVFTALSAYAGFLRQQYEPGCRMPDRRKYDVYYATMQALVYIFCFRWRELLSKRRRRSSMLARPQLFNDDVSDGDSDEEDDFVIDDEALGTEPLTWAPNVKETFLLNFHCRLNPLKVMAPEVTEEFARIAHHLNFLYIYPLLNHNRRIRLQGGSSYSSMTSVGGGGARETALDALRGDRHLQLDAYFPFDPYALPISKRWLEGDYNVWREPPGMSSATQASAGQPELALQAEDDSTDESDSEEEDDDEEDFVRPEDERTATPGSEE